MSRTITITLTVAEALWLARVAKHGARRGQFDSLIMGKRDIAICANAYSKLLLAQAKVKEKKSLAVRPKQFDWSGFLTGAQLRYAIANKLPVRYVEKHHDPREWGRNYSEDTCMVPAKVGVYIGPSDLDPDDFKDGDPVYGECPEYIWAVYPASGKTAADYCKPF